MEMAMRLQMEAESDVRSHSQSQEESDAALGREIAGAVRGILRLTAAPRRRLPRAHRLP